MTGINDQLNVVMKKYTGFVLLVALIGPSCHRSAVPQFFSKTSFWNTPIPPNAPIDGESDRLIAMLETEPTKHNFVINIDKWTIPVYEVSDTTPRYKVLPSALTEGQKKGWKTERTHFGHGVSFAAEAVPIPYSASPDKEQDHHMALVDYKNRIAWDMWGLTKRPDGSWISNTGMKYSIDGDGTFVNDAIQPNDGESVHFHGPSRAAGVPAIAGLIMYNEVMAGEIKHKLAACTRFSAYKKFTYPAIWTDGFARNGLPEGSVLQLDPDLDLSKFNLLPGELVVAKAAQKYGIVIVDVGGGQALYAEGLWGHAGKSWKGVLRSLEGITSIPYKHYRVIKMGNITEKGDDHNSKLNPLDL